MRLRPITRHTMSRPHSMGEYIDHTFDNILLRYAHMKRAGEIRSITYPMVYKSLRLVHPDVSKDYVQKRIDFKKQQARIVEKLNEIPLVEQRSPEWYSLRENLITASDFKLAVGNLDKPAPSNKQMYKKKCGYVEDVFSLATAPPLLHGIKFEEVANMIYKKKRGCDVYEYGLIPHPRVSYIGASPDGISSDGVMLEIKSPYSRKIHRGGGVPDGYYLQIQGQLEVCNLEECDYLECDFQLYKTWDEFSADVNYDMTRTKNNQYKGSVVSYFDKKKQATCYMYSPLNMVPDDLRQWVVGVHEDVKRNGGMVTNTEYWWNETYNIRRVYRNRHEFHNIILPRITTVWNNIMMYRGDKTKYDNDVLTTSSKDVDDLPDRGEFSKQELRSMRQSLLHPSCNN